MSNIVNYILQENQINKLAYCLSVLKEQETDIRINYDKFTKCYDNYIENLDKVVLDEIKANITSNSLKNYFYNCLSLNKTITSVDINILMEDKDFFDYNLIVLNTMLNF